MIRTLWLLVATVLGLPAWAEQQEPSEAAAIMAEQVRIQLWSVHALKGGGRIDSELGDMAKHLASLEYGSLALIKKDFVALSVRAGKKIDIVGDHSVRVSVLERNASRVRVRLQMYDARGVILDTTVSIRRNGFFIVAGPRYDGGMLVLPIFARY